MWWVVHIISELDATSNTQSQGKERSKRPGSSHGVQTRDRHSKRAKVIKDSATDLSSLTFSESHDTRPNTAVSSSPSTLPHIGTSTGTPSSAAHILATAPITAPIGTVVPVSIYSGSPYRVDICHDDYYNTINIRA
ncbi:hypothetical protein L7F22_000723 [Adiantum nelumboides]|nr:hypothetical protein [Adiantum nelumboides]